MTSRRLQAHSDLDQLKRQAKELLTAFRAADPAAVAEVNAHYRGADPAAFALHHAQLAIARSYGFDSWPKLKAYVDGATVARLAELVQAGDVAQVSAMLHTRPELANMQMAYVDERRPLHFAVMSRSAEMVRLLLAHGADPRRGVYPHRAATTALIMATERGYDEIVSILQERAPQSGPERADDSPDPLPGAEARDAVARGDIEWLQARHAEGALVNPITWSAGGLLTAAVAHNRPDILTLLLEFRFDPNERVRSVEVDGECWSQAFPLWNCAAEGHREMAEILLAHGADPNAHVNSAGSSVYSAYSHRQWEMVDLLRRHGGIVTADIAALYRETDLAREMLAQPHDAELAQQLLRYGASGGANEIVRMALKEIEWPRDDQRWQIYLCEAMSFWHHIPWLYAGNKDLDRGTYIDCFRQILGRGSANLTGMFGRTLLHEIAALRDWIAEEEALEFARAALEAGARMDGRDELLRSTPLGWACRWGRLEVARELLARGADPVERDAEAWARPRAWAAKRGHVAIVELLRGYGG